MESDYFLGRVLEIVKLEMYIIYSIEGSLVVELVSYIFGL